MHRESFLEIFRLLTMRERGMDMLSEITASEFPSAEDGKIQYLNGRYPTYT